MEIIKRGSPINPNSKKEKPAMPSSIMVLLTIMFGGVPVKVSNPPVFEPKAIGIKSLEGMVPAFQAAEIVTGSKAATVPVLLTKPDKRLAPMVTMTKSRGTLLPAHDTNFWPAKAVHPVRDRPSPIIKSAAIIMTVGLLKPLRVSVRSRIPLRYSTNMEIKATTSGGNFPHMKRAMVIVRIINNSSIGRFDLERVRLRIYQI